MVNLVKNGIQVFSLFIVIFFPIHTIYSQNYIPHYKKIDCPLSQERGSIGILKFEFSNNIHDSIYNALIRYNKDNNRFNMVIRNNILFELFGEIKRDDFKALKRLYDQENKILYVISGNKNENDYLIEINKTEDGSLVFSNRYRIGEELNPIADFVRLFEKCEKTEYTPAGYLTVNLAPDQKGKIIIREKEYNIGEKIKLEHGNHSVKVMPASAKEVIDTTVTISRDLTTIITLRPLNISSKPKLESVPQELSIIPWYKPFLPFALPGYSQIEKGKIKGWIFSGIVTVSLAGAYFSYQELIKERETYKSLERIYLDEKSSSNYAASVNSLSRCKDISTLTASFLISAGAVFIINIIDIILSDSNIESEKIELSSGVNGIQFGRLKYYVTLGIRF